MDNDETENKRKMDSHGLEKKIKIRFLKGDESHILLNISNKYVRAINISKMTLYIQTLGNERFSLRYGPGLHDIILKLKIKDFDPNTLIKYLITRILAIIQKTESNKIVLSSKELKFGKKIKNRFILFIVGENFLKSCPFKDVEIKIKNDYDGDRIIIDSKCFYHEVIFSKEKYKTEMERIVETYINELYDILTI